MIEKRESTHLQANQIWIWIRRNKILDRDRLIYKIRNKRRNKLCYAKRRDHIVTGNRSSIMLDSISANDFAINFSKNKYFSKQYWKSTLPPQNFKTNGKLIILDHFGYSCQKNRDKENLIKRFPADNA